MLSESNVLGFYDYLIATKGNATNTAHLRVTHIRALWRWSSTCAEWIDVVPRYVEVELPQADAPPRKRAPTWSQLDKMIAELEHLSVTRSASNQKRPQAIGAHRAVVLMRFTGLRRSQVCELAWEDFDLENAELYVRPELGKSKAERRGRTIPISKHLVEVMAGWGRRDGLVCLSVETQVVNYYLIRAFKAAEIPEEVWRRQSAHCLRRSFTSELVSRGAMRFAVEILCGRSTGVGGDVYTDPRFLWEKLRETVDLIQPLGISNETEISTPKISSSPIQ